MIKSLARRLLPPILKHIPTNQKWLYPFYLSAQLALREEAFTTDKLPASFSGLTITYASDIHYGSYMSEERALEVTRRITELESDLIILGGDYGEDAKTAEAYFDLIPSFPENVPVLAAIGNHDHMGQGANINRLMDMMRSKGVTPLKNDVWLMTRDKHRLAFCAPDDLLAGFPDFEPLKKKSQGADFILFMPHSPDLIPEARQAGFAFDLALCGHTHGGQIAPFGRSLHASSRYKDRYRKGWVREEGADIFITCGVGTSIMPIRLGTYPEIHQFTLYAK